MPQLLIATGNPGKAADFQRLLNGCGWDLVTPAALGLALSDEEPFQSYAENAALKARSGAEASGLVTLADDSGIEIEALGGEPGPRSARYLGDGAGYDVRFARILAEMDGLPSYKRWAKFRCVIAVAAPGADKPKLFEGEATGMIDLAPRGDLGFGYDPIFYLPALARTMAELPPAIKDIISHRGRAAMRARVALKEMLHERREKDAEPVARA